MPTTQPAFHGTAAEHRHAVEGTCPYCEQPIPNDRAEEIRARFAFKQKQDEATMKARFEQQVASAKEEMELAKKAEIDKVKADAVAQANTAREEGKKAAEAEAQQRLAALQATQEVDKKKLLEVDEQRLGAISQLQALKTQTEAVVAARVAEARAAIEKNSAETVNLKGAQHAAAMQKVSEELKSMHRRVADVEGEGADLNLYDELRKTFPKDAITPVSKSSGANIIHVVKHNGKECGKIVYDGRNRNIWQAAFATKLRSDMLAAKAQHAILTCSKFPSGIRQIHLCEGVIASNPARAVVLAQILRDHIISNYAQRVSEKDRSEKTVKLYSFITSDQFEKLLGTLEANDEKVLQQIEDEQKAHKAMWDKRWNLATESQRLHGKLQGAVARIIGTDGTDSAHDQH